MIQKTRWYFLSSKCKGFSAENTHSCEQKIAEVSIFSELKWLTEYLEVIFYGFLELLLFIIIINDLFQFGLWQIVHEIKSIKWLSSAKKKKKKKKKSNK